MKKHIFLILFLEISSSQEEILIRPKKSEFHLTFLQCKGLNSRTRDSSLILSLPHPKHMLMFFRFYTIHAPEAAAAARCPEIGRAHV